MTGAAFGAPPPQPEPGPEVPPVDLGNPVLAPDRALLSLYRITPPGGEQLVSLTIRTPSTTLTVFLGRDDALTWARMLRTEAQRLSGLIVPSGGLNGAHG